ncbi:MAG TPA: stress protein [Rhodospirillaceae bacterium]|nr:MAG: hypothetical protein A2018_06875 [Alphaproteobacteria bacterium GWF2_58_20]HAU29905.1 stress protein [Rhodospirillaceae bacterium]
MIPLQPGDKNDLASLTPEGTTHVVAGLGWVPAPAPGFFASLFGQGKTIDLNLVCLVFDAEGNMIANTTGANMIFGDGSIQHTGDDKIGTGSGDDEQVFVAPEKIPDQAKHLVFAMHSTSGHTFSEIHGITCRITAFPGDTEILRYTLPEKDRMKAHLIASMSRSENGWVLQAIGESIFARTPEEYREMARKHLGLNT